MHLRTTADLKISDSVERAANESKETFVIHDIELRKEMNTYGGEEPL